jgi:hypothetical protein
MDEQRFDELDEKRSEEGLNHEEAHELGRLIAEKEGKPYSSHDDRAEGDEEPKAWEEAAKEGEESHQDEMANPGPADDHLPEEERAVGTERQPVAPGTGGYVPPKGGQELPEDEEATG